MITKLRLFNFPANQNVHVLEQDFYPFVLKTCQRTLVVSFEHIPAMMTHKIDFKPEVCEGEAAYLYLLEVICGLKSKLIAENEIVNQFKLAYRDFLSHEKKQRPLSSIIEKLFKDAKTIRSEYLLGIGQKTYASLTRKLLLQEAKASHVMILGSGAMAEDVINQLKKKTKITLVARNSEKQAELCDLHGLDSIAWNDRFRLLHFPHIVNTIGASDILFGPEFFAEWSALHQTQKLWVDLGSPCSIKTDLSKNDQVVRLDDIFAEGAIQEDDKFRKVQEARFAMQDLTGRRAQLFSQNYAPYSSPITQFSL